LDIQDFDGYKRLFKETKPNVVIHTASIGSPDYAEKYKEITWRINVSAMDNIISLCNEYGSKLVYISSNGIYDGEHAPYAENDKALPVNFYGKVKLEGETLVLSSRCVSAIVRPNIMYGWHHPFERSNIVTLALDKLSKNERFMAYEDVYVKPLYVEECARAIFRIIEEEKYGTFNIAGCDRVSIYELTKKAAQIFGLDDGLVIPIGQGYFNELVSRPRDTSYKTDKMENELKIKPIGIEEGLSIMKRKRNPR
jgi:dTDP-4-dehydrorhamnose reductase